jgi:ribulose-phosphate 3-epimerase
VIDIQVDGGINLDTAPKVVGAGATVLSVGTSIFRAEDPVVFVKKLRKSLITTL